MASRGTGLKLTAAGLALSVPLILGACSGSPATKTASSAAKGSAVKQASPTPTVAVSPILDSTKVPVSAEIGTAANNGVVSAVSLVSASGKQVSGAMRGDGSSWVPSTPLAYAQQYTATVTVTGIDGRTAQTTTSFVTMPKPATKPISTSVNLFDDETYGVAMPIVIDFGASIPKASRQAVQNRLFVTSSPAQLGAWRWISDREIVYRPESYWKTGTTLSVRSALGGVPVGGRVLDKDRTAVVTIGRDLEMSVTNKNHMMTVTSNGKVIESYPISMGKSSTPSWSGQFVIMDRLPATVFDTLDDGPGGYRVAVKYAERLTWSGTFLHSAPWSVYAQGHFNVSHGCVNIGPSNAKWIYQHSMVGDPVSISGTPRHVAEGNGWTAWDLSWTDFIKGSAVPVTVTVPSTYVPSF
jgi:lipoprotein-anchoring transpeptidase ErfK/SrfK